MHAQRRLSAGSTFRPNVGPAAFGSNGTRVSVNAKGKWKLEGMLTGCAGTQSGGKPRALGSIAKAQIVMRGKMVKHSCADLTAHGIAVRSLRIKWLNAAGRVKGITKGAGSVRVTGLGNGSAFLDFPYNLVPDPSYVAPGIITFHGTGTAATTAQAFPGRPITMTAVDDQTVSMMPYQCSDNDNPGPLTIESFDFHGVNGPSTISIG